MTGDIRLICPGRTLNEISRMLGTDEETIALYVQKNMLMVRIEDTVLTSRLYEGEFVNVNGIVPREFQSEAVIDKNELDESVERAAVLARTDKNSIVTLDIREDSMGISSNTAIGKVNERVGLLLEGKDVTISLNCKYLSECLNAVSDGKDKNRAERSGVSLRRYPRGGRFLPVFDTSCAHICIKTVDSRADFYV